MSESDRNDRNDGTPPRQMPRQMPTMPTIEDHHVAAKCEANPEAGTLALRFWLCDERDPTMKAHVDLEIEPSEAIDLIDRMIGELGKLGVRISASDEGAGIDGIDSGRIS